MAGSKNDRKWREACSQTITGVRAVISTRARRGILASCFRAGVEKEKLEVSQLHISLFFLCIDTCVTL